MSLCVAVCTRGRPSQLTLCIESIVRSPLVDQIVVSSDGVDNETDLVVWQARERYPHVDLVRGPRVGLAANRNACIGASRTNYIHFLDDDARLDPGFLPTALPLADQGRLVTGWELQHGTRIVPHHPSFLGFQQVAATPPLHAIVINATIFPVPFLRANPFDEYYRFGSEELDIAMRAVSSGLEIVPVDAGNVHLHVPNGRSGNDRSATRSRIYFTARRYTRYEPSIPRLVTAMACSATNAVGHGLKASGLAGAIRASGDVAHASMAAVTRQQPHGRADVAGGARGTPDPTVSVVVATYRRAQQLGECLSGLGQQVRPPEEIVVVRRNDDSDAGSVLRTCSQRVHEVIVDEPGQVAALRAGAVRATGDVIAFLDDDAVPRRDWLKRLLAPYSDPAVAAVGGRDVVHHDGHTVSGSANRVGRFSRYGRLSGNHHVGVGWPRDVDVLKGCNCSYRRGMLRLPRGLRGDGAQVGNDMATSLRAATLGGRVVYEPGALVDHYPGPRFDEDARRDPSPRAVLDSVYNQTYVIASLRPDLRNRRLAYLLLVGDRAVPGAARTAIARLRRERHLHGRFPSTAKTVLRADRDARRSPLQFDPPLSP
jgi:GT2 family glycosyltransferase